MIGIRMTVDRIEDGQSIDHGREFGDVDGEGTATRMTMDN